MPIDLLVDNQLNFLLYKKFKIYFKAHLAY